MAKIKPLYEVRVRENGVKKSKFYRADSSKEAAANYKGPGFVMWASKVGREKLWGVGEFFRLGDNLLRDLKKEESGVTLLSEKEKARKTYFHRREKNKKERGLRE